MMDSELKAGKQAAFAGLCDFVLGWYDLTESLAGEPIASDAPVPVVVRILNDKLGALWLLGEHPIGGNRTYRGLFDCQNVIVNPGDYAEDLAPSYGAGGSAAVCALAGHQGVTNFGFSLDDPDGAVYVSGDWLGDYGPWRAIDGFIEDAFAMWLLINFLTVDGHNELIDWVRSAPDDETTIELYTSGPGLGSERYGGSARTDGTHSWIYYDQLGWLVRSPRSADE